MPRMAKDRPGDDPTRCWGPPPQAVVEGAQGRVLPSGDPSTTRFASGPPPRSGEDPVRVALSAATEHFAFSATPRLDAELLMAHALGITREQLLLRHLDDAVPPAFAGFAERRVACEPVAYITGTRAFWSIDLEVGPGVLIPRADSETLIEVAIAHFAGTTGPRTVLDLGTGPGTLLFAALTEWPQAHGTGVDASATALDYARRNADRLGMADRATLRLGDWAARIDGRLDLILCNPPYVGAGEALGIEVAGHEPAEALFAGADGLDAYRMLAPQIARVLASSGVACIEIGWTQAAAVIALLSAEGLRVDLHHDLAGRDRCLSARLEPVRPSPHISL